MKQIAFFILILFPGQVLVAQLSPITQTIRGIVTDEQSGNVLSNVTVMIEGRNSAGNITDSLGNFKLKAIPIGRQTIRVTLMGYEEPVRLAFSQISII